MKRRLIVVGCAHSGADVVRRLLGTHPGVYDFEASGLFAEAGGSQLRYPWASVGLSLGRERRLLDHVLARACSEPDEWPSLPPRTVRQGRACRGAVATLDRVALANGCRSWVEHTPGEGLRARRIQRMVPRAHIVHVVRDGRDVVASLCTRAARRRGGHCRAGDARRAIECWNRSLAAHARCLDHDHHSFVLYEDLLAHPQRAFARLTRECGLPEAGLEVVAEVEAAPPRSERSRFRELFDAARRRRIEARLDLARYGRLAEHLRRAPVASRVRWRPAGGGL